MNLAKTAGAGVSLAVCLALAGCYEDNTVKLHEPGQYLGTRDTLLNASGTPELQDKLSQRFNHVQTDR